MTNWTICQQDVRLPIAMLSLSLGFYMLCSVIDYVRDHFDE